MQRSFVILQHFAGRIAGELGQGFGQPLGDQFQVLVMLFAVPLQHGRFCVKQCGIARCLVEEGRNELIFECWDRLGRWLYGELVGGRSLFVGANCEG
jgi:hypothetical protein